MRGSPGMIETGRDLDIVAEEFANQPVAIIEWEFAQFEPEIRLEMISESGAPNVPATMIDSSRLYTRSWYPDYPDHFRNMLNSSLNRPSRADIVSSWVRNEMYIEVSGSITNKSGFELNTTNKARIQVLAYEDYKNTATHTSSRIGRGHGFVAISSLADGASMNFSVPFYMATTPENWDNVHFVTLVDYHLPGNGMVNSLPVFEGVYDQLNAVFTYQEGEGPIEGFEVDPTEIVAEIHEDDLGMLSVDVLISGAPFQTWSATVDQDFVLLEPAEGAINSTMVVTFDKEKLVEGEQTATIIVIDGAELFEKPISVKVTYTLAEDPEPDPFMLYFPMIMNGESAE